MSKTHLNVSIFARWICHILQNSIQYYYANSICAWDFN